MTGFLHIRRLSLAAALASAAIAPAAAPSASSPSPSAQMDASMAALLEYLQRQNSTGLIVIQDGRVLVERTWDAPADDRQFQLFVHGRAEDGALLEDVASQQKSFVSVLIAIAIDKGLIEVEKPVSHYLGMGWSKAPAEREAKIRVLDLLHMSSGLDERFGYIAPAGTVFFYNTPVYAIGKRIVATVAGLPLDTVTRAWLTGPAEMNDTAWRRRPAALGNIGNETGLVTTPHDTALFGSMILNQGVATNGKRIVSRASLKAMFERAPTNPAYGRLWWLNGGDYAIGALGDRRQGPLVAAAPPDMMAAFGALNRRLYVVPSRKLVVVRTGAAAPDKDFDQQFWLRLNNVIRRYRLLDSDRGRQVQIANL